jgi:hypothetical protein
MRGLAGRHARPAARPEPGVEPAGRAMQQLSLWLLLGAMSDGPRQDGPRVAMAAAWSPSHPPLRHGELLFVSPRLDPAFPFDAAILQTGEATIAWLHQHGVVGIHLPVAMANVTATHVALAWRGGNATSALPFSTIGGQPHGDLHFIEALPQVGVVVTPAAAFFAANGGAPGAGGTSYWRGAVGDGRQQQQQPSRLAARAAEAAWSQRGKPYAADFEPPSSGRFYCSSLAVWAYRAAAAKPDGVLLPEGLNYTMIFEPLTFWEAYYRRLNLSLPVNDSGSNPTLLMHAGRLTMSKLSDLPDASAIKEGGRVGAGASRSDSIE